MERMLGIFYYKFPGATLSQNHSVQVSFGTGNNNLNMSCKEMPLHLIQEFHMEDKCGFRVWPSWTLAIDPVDPSEDTCSLNQPLDHLMHHQDLGDMERCRVGFCSRTQSNLVLDLK